MKRLFRLWTLKDFPVLFKIMKLIDDDQAAPHYKPSTVIKSKFVRRFQKAEESLQVLVGVQASEIGIKAYGWSQMWVGAILAGAEEEIMEKVVRHFKVRAAYNLLADYFDHCMWIDPTGPDFMFDLDYKAFYRHENLCAGRSKAR